MLFLQACPEDAFNDLYNELRFTFQGLPSRENLSPSLAPQVQTTSIHPVSRYQPQLANIDSFIYFLLNVNKSFSVAINYCIISCNQLILSIFVSS